MPAMRPVSAIAPPTLPDDGRDVHVVRPMVGAPHDATHGDEQRTHLEERAYQEASGLNKIDYAYLLLLNQNNKKN
jgi:hypothetical protein